MLTTAQVETVKLLTELMMVEAIVLDELFQWKKEAALKPVFC